jgi:hypothetical protein
MNRGQILDEKGEFQKIHGAWFYIDGTLYTDKYESAA